MGDSIFYSRIKALTYDLGKSLNEVEKDLNYPRNALNNYKENRIPSGIRLLELAEYFEVNPEYLIKNVKDYKKKEIFSTKKIFKSLTPKQRFEMMELCDKWLHSLS